MNQAGGGLLWSEEKTPYCVSKVVEWTGGGGRESSQSESSKQDRGDKELTCNQLALLFWISHGWKSKLASSKKYCGWFIFYVSIIPLFLRAMNFRSPDLHVFWLCEDNKGVRSNHRHNSAQEKTSLDPGPTCCEGRVTNHWDTSAFQYFWFFYCRQNPIFRLLNILQMKQSENKNTVVTLWSNHFQFVCAQ